MSFRFAIPMVLLGTGFVGPVQACDGRVPPRPFVEEVKHAGFVVVGEVGVVKKVKDPNGDEKENAEYRIAEVIKDHPSLKGKQSLSANYYRKFMEQHPDAKRFVLFGDVEEGKPEVFMLLPLGKGDSVLKYLKDALGNEKKPSPGRLRFYVDHLRQDNRDIADDAAAVLRRASYDELVIMCRDHGRGLADQLRGWVKNADFNHPNLGLIIDVLGICGSKEDGPLLRRLAERAEKGDGFLRSIYVAYLSVDPPEAWPHVRGIISKPNYDFNLRYPALISIRFAYEQRKDLVARKELLEALRVLLDQGDIADLVIEDLRRWKDWSLTKEILDAAQKKSHQLKIVQGCILKYMLQCPEDQHQGVRAYVENVKKKDPQWVKDAIEVLDLEKEALQGEKK